jgi:hypothetical protein
MIKKTIKQIKTSQAQAQKTADHLNQEVIVIAQNKQHIQVQAGKAYQLSAKDFNTKKASLIAKKVGNDLEISLCTNKKIVVATSHFLKFQAQAAIKTLISAPICPFSRFLDSLKSDFKCPIIGSMAARLFHSLRFLSR